jgi:hypothetical protein
MSKLTLHPILTLEVLKARGTPEEIAFECIEGIPKKRFSLLWKMLGVVDDSDIEDALDNGTLFALAIKENIVKTY